MSPYASETSVPIERSKGEIERILTRYGADGFQAGWHRGQGLAMVAFEVRGRHVRFMLAIPALEEFQKTETGRARSEASAFKAWEQAQRQRWRALTLVVKAKLEAVEAGITTFEQEFLAHLVLPDGQTVDQVLVPRIIESIDAGAVPTLRLPEAGK